MTAKIFVSYSHRDEYWLGMVKKHIAPRGAGGVADLDVWDDKRIPPASEWFAEIENAITSSQASLLLVSQNFLDSEFIWKHEVPKLVELRATGHKIFWLPVSDSGYTRTRLGDLQSLWPPGDPLDLKSEPLQNAALVKITEAFERALGSTLGDAKGGRIAESGQASERPPASAPAATTARLSKDFLHVLIDRKPQEDPLALAASAKSAAAGSNVFFLPAGPDDCPDLMAERIERYTFPFRVKRQAQVIPIEWPRDEEDADAGLRRHVVNILATQSIELAEDDVGTGNAAELEKMTAFRATIANRAPVFCSYLRSEPQSPAQLALLNNCAKWWTEFGVSESVHPYALYCIHHKSAALKNFADLKGVSGWWDGCLDLVKPGQRLKPLQPIQLADVQDWLASDALRRSYHVTAVEDAATALFSGTDALPMKRIGIAYETAWMNLLKERAG